MNCRTVCFWYTYQFFLNIAGNIRNVLAFYIFSKTPLFIWYLQVLCYYRTLHFSKPCMLLWLDLNCEKQSYKVRFLAKFCWRYKKGFSNFDSSLDVFGIGPRIICPLYITLETSIKSLSLKTYNVYVCLPITNITFHIKFS